MSDPYRLPRPFRRLSRYGNRTHPITGEEKLHAGDDWAAPEGTAIPAATAGEVVYSEFNDGLGNTVIVKTTNGYSLYAHMTGDAPRARVGDRIWPGDIVGHVGSTGRSTGNHLHYTTITRGEPAGRKGGAIGVSLDKDHTTDPDLFDTGVRYPNQTLQARRAMVGPDNTQDASTLGRQSSPRMGAYPPGSFAAAPTFADRFGNWTFSKNGASAPAPEPKGLPALIMDHIQRQNERDAAIAPPAIAGSQQPIPFLPDDGEGSFADRFGDRPPVRRLSSYISRR